MILFHFICKYQINFRCLVGYTIESFFRIIAIQKFHVVALVVSSICINFNVIGLISIRTFKFKVDEMTSLSFNTLKMRIKLSKVNVLNCFNYFILPSWTRYMIIWLAAEFFISNWSHWVRISWSSKISKAPSKRL